MKMTNLHFQKMLKKCHSISVEDIFLLFSHFLRIFTAIIVIASPYIIVGDIAI